MVAHKTEEELREDLARLDNDIARMRDEAAELRRESAERWDAPRDSQDISAALTSAEELEAVIAELEARRESLSRQLTGGSR
jgi:hypothetical protein